MNPPGKNEDRGPSIDGLPEPTSQPWIAASGARPLHPYHGSVTEGFIVDKNLV
jgi:hypothetical protein